MKAHLPAWLWKAQCGAHSSTCRLVWQILKVIRYVIIPNSFM